MTNSLQAMSFTDGTKQRSAEARSDALSGTDNRGLTFDNYRLSNECMKAIQPEHEETFQELKRVRRQALDHARAARDLSRQRAELIKELTSSGYAQADIARELGVTRQAIQKMITAR